MLDDDPLMTALSGDPAGRTLRDPRDPRVRPPQTFDLSGYGGPISSFTQQQRQPNAGGAAVRGPHGDPRERTGFGGMFQGFANNPYAVAGFDAIGSGLSRLGDVLPQNGQGIGGLLEALWGANGPRGIGDAVRDWRGMDPREPRSRDPRVTQPGVPVAAPAPVAPVAPAIPAGPTNRIGSSYGVQGAFNPGGQFSLPRY